ncbi:unnamed protein product [Closterium sp. NIES-54]
MGGGGRGGGGGVTSGGGRSAGVGGAPRAAPSDSPAAAGGVDTRRHQTPAGLPTTGAGVAAWYQTPQQQPPGKGSGPRQLSRSAVHPPCTYIVQIGTRRGLPCGRSHTPVQCFAQLTDTLRAAYDIDGPTLEWLPFLHSHGAALWGMSASQLLLSLRKSSCYVCPRAAPEDASLSFTLESRASCCFFCDHTTLTLLPAPVSVALADPTSGPVTARYTTTLPCPAVPSGFLAGFHVPSFSRNLVGVRPLVDSHVGVWIEPSGDTATCLSRVLPSLPTSLAPPCAPCVEGRLRATPHSSSLRPTTEPFEALHLDVGGPASRPGLERESFFLVVVDDYSRYTIVFPLAKKSEVTYTLVWWLLTTADTRGRRISCLHSDRGGEFRSGVLVGFCHEQSIRQPWSLLESPQQNGVAEHRIGLVMDIARTSMIHARAPHFLWPCAVRYAAHQLNPGHVSPGQGLHQPVFGLGPLVLHRVFVSGAAWHLFVTPPRRRSCLAPADPGSATSGGVGVGAESVPPQGSGSGGAGVGAEPESAGGSSLWGAGVSRAVPGGVTTGGAGAPTTGPGESGTGRVAAGGAGSGGGATGALESGRGATTAPDTSRSPRAHPSCPVPLTDFRTVLFRPGPPHLSPSVLPSPLESALTASLSTPVTDYYRAFRPVLTRVLASLVTDPRASLSFVSILTAGVNEFASTRCLDYATSLVAAPPTSPMAVRGESALGCDALEERQFELEFLAGASPHLRAMLLAPEGDPDALDIPTPCTYAEAVSGPWASHWRAAMESEMTSYTSTGTYVDEAPPLGANVVDGMWIFRVKRPPGSPSVFKVRYVARGFSQREGVDFFHTFAPTPKMTTLRVLLHVAAQRDYELHSLDFSTAFLQGSLHEEVWLRRPSAFTCTFPPGTQWSLSRLLPTQDHRLAHWRAAVRVEKYLATTSGMGLVLRWGKFVVLNGHCNSSCADDAETRRSTQGYCFSLGYGAVLWRSTRFSSVSTSTAEAEIYAGVMAAQELRWWTFLLTDLGERPSSAPTLFADNKASILLGREPRLESRVKHINVGYFLLRELQRRGQTCFDFVESEANTADIFIKALPPSDHQRCCVQLGLVDTGYRLA